MSVQGGRSEESLQQETVALRNEVERLAVELQQMTQYKEAIAVYERQMEQMMHHTERLESSLQAANSDFQALTSNYEALTENLQRERPPEGLTSDSFGSPWALGVFSAFVFSIIGFSIPSANRDLWGAILFLVGFCVGSAVWMILARQLDRRVAPQAERRVNSIAS